MSFPEKRFLAESVLLSCLGGTCLLSSASLSALSGRFSALDLMASLAFFAHRGAPNGGLPAAGGGVVSAGSWFSASSWNLFLGAAFGLVGEVNAAVPPPLGTGPRLFRWLSLPSLGDATEQTGSELQNSQQGKQFAGRRGGELDLRLVSLSPNGSMADTDRSSLPCFSEEEKIERNQQNQRRNRAREKSRRRRRDANLGAGGRLPEVVLGRPRVPAICERIPTEKNVRSRRDEINSVSSEAEPGFRRNGDEIAR
jgi:hypothetical protein